MITGIDILRSVVEATNEVLSDANRSDITFFSGYTSTVTNEMTNLMRGNYSDPFPVFCVFTEDMKETTNGNLLQVEIKKVVIACRAIPNLTEAQRLASSFDNILHPIYKEFCAQMAKLFPYTKQWSHTRADVPLYAEAKKTSNPMNAIVDAVVIRNLKFNFYKSKCND